MSDAKVVSPLKELNINSEKRIDATNVNVPLKKEHFDTEKTVFIRNLPKDSTKNDLRSFFKKESDSLKIQIYSRSFLKKLSNRTRIVKYAFIEFPAKIDIDSMKVNYGTKPFMEGEPLHLEKAMTEAERLMMNTERVIKNNSNNNKRKPTDLSRLESPEKIVVAKPPLDDISKHENTLFVRNIPYGIKKEELAEYFNTSAESVRIPMRRFQDLQTGRQFTSNEKNKGFAFIAYNNLTTEDDMNQKVKEFNGKLLNNRHIIVARSINSTENIEFTKK